MPAAVGLQVAGLPTLTSSIASPRNMSAQAQDTHFPSCIFHLGLSNRRFRSVYPDSVPQLPLPSPGPRGLTGLLPSVVAGADIGAFFITTLVAAGHSVGFRQRSKNKSTGQERHPGPMTRSLWSSRVACAIRRLRLLNSWFYIEAS